MHLTSPSPKWERLLGYSFVIYRRRMKDTQTDRWSDRQRGKTVTFYTLIESHAMEKLSYLHSINEQISNAVCYVTFFKVSVINCQMNLHFIYKSYCQTSLISNTFYTQMRILFKMSGLPSTQIISYIFNLYIQ